MAFTKLRASAAQRLAPIVETATPLGPLRFYCPSPSAAKRARKLMQSEPDTIDWLRTSLRPGDHLWDVGANVGAYTLFACLVPEVTVTAFEPVAGTFAVLSRNVALNRLGPRAAPLCIALSNANGLVPMYLKSAEPGAAMHAIAEPRNTRGTFEPAERTTVLAMRGDELVAREGVKKPNHLKIDVDGHEMHVLEGLDAALATTRTILVEMMAAADATGENARIESFLSARGFIPRGRPVAGRNCVYVNSKLS